MESLKELYEQLAKAENEAERISRLLLNTHLKALVSNKYLDGDLRCVKVSTRPFAESFTIQVDDNFWPRWNTRHVVVSLDGEVNYDVPDRVDGHFDDDYAYTTKLKTLLEESREENS